MKKNEVKIGGTYTAKVTNKLVTVKIVRTASNGGWHATNLTTGKAVHIKSAGRLRGPAGDTTVDKPAPKKASKAKPAPAATPESEPAPAVTAPEAATEAAPVKNLLAPGSRMSQLDAAAEVLRILGTPLNCPGLVKEMAERGLWTSPGGKTPAATLHAGISTEIRKKGDKARFRKGDRGQFEANA
jgi:hypothetical protein